MKVLNIQAFDIELTLTSSNKKSIHAFLSLFKQLYFITFIEKLKIVPAKQKKYQLSILKSPHVNKIAQEQFHLNKVKYKLKITKTHVIHLLLFLKLLKNAGLADVNIKCKFFLPSNKNLTASLKKLNTDPDKNLSPLVGFNVVKYLELLDLYGEILNKKLA